MNGDHPETPGAVLAQVLRVLASHHIDDFAFTGGVAVGVWATPRQTRDVDLCGVLPPDEVDRLLALRDGIRSGPEPLPDVVRFRVGDWDIDLFVSKSAYDLECLRRALRATVDGVDVRVVTAEDLLLHKMLKLRHDRRRVLQDVADLRAILLVRATEIDWSYIVEWALPDEAEFLRSVARLDDAAILERLLRPR